MAESESESKEFYTLILFIAVGVAAIALAVFYYYRALKSEHEYYRRNKQCYEELTLLIDRSSMQKSKWIENTILAEKHALGSTNYCWILDLVQGTQHIQKNDGIEKSEKRDQSLKTRKEGNNGRLSDH